MQSWLTSIFQLIDSSEASSSEPTRQKLLVDEEQHSKHSYSSPQSECMVDICNVGYNYHDEESGIVAFPTPPTQAKRWIRVLVRSRRHIFECWKSLKNVIPQDPPTTKPWEGVLRAM